MGPHFQVFGESRFLFSSGSGSPASSALPSCPEDAPRKWRRALLISHAPSRRDTLPFICAVHIPALLPTVLIDLSFSVRSSLLLLAPLAPLPFLLSSSPCFCPPPPGSRRDGGGPAGDGAPGAPAREIPEDSGGGLGGNGGVGRDDNKQYVAAIFILSHATAVHEYILIPFCFCFLPHSLLL